MTEKKDQRKRLFALLEILKPDELRDLEVLMEAMVRGVAVGWSKLEQRVKGDKLTVLDPTCGSGAFLFAALNILEPLYEGCLQRMEVFIEEAEDGRGDPGDRPGPRRYADFRHVLEDVARHPNRRYHALKSIIVNNLYGVDIMEEAVEICKLRLFLKLGPRWRARSTSSRCRILISTSAPATPWWVTPATSR